MRVLETSLGCQYLMQEDNTTKTSNLASAPGDGGINFPACRLRWNGMTNCPSEYHFWNPVTGGSVDKSLHTSPFQILLMWSVSDEHWQHIGKNI